MITGYRRSALYVPGDNPKMLEKSRALAADMLVLNLEDGVAPSRKTEARQNILHALESLDFGEREILVRVNDADGPVGREDLAAIVPRRPDGITLPKVENAGEIRDADLFLVDLERRHAIPEGTTKLHAMIESASGVIHAAEIAAASPRMSSLVFGAADYAKEIGCDMGEDRQELWLALQWVVTSARAAGIDCIDAPCFEIRNVELVRKEAIQVRRLGYDGKSAIHPSQIEVINQVFDVTAEEIGWAEKVLSELDEAEARGKGVSTLAGRLIESPHRVAAERLLRRSGRRGVGPR
jgi:citrate lyase subunit beta / citryl-CoA lyase